MPTTGKPGSNPDSASAGDATTGSAAGGAFFVTAFLVRDFLVGMDWVISFGRRDNARAFFARTAYPAAGSRSEAGCNGCQ
jgi:hypothetical protein